VRIAALRTKLESQNITISVIGQFKRGKSALVNAILEEELLPVGIVPITSAVTEIKHGNRNASVHFKNGRIKNVSPSELNIYINEQENPDNILGVTSVSLNIPSPFLEEGLTFVDTPGVGSYHKHNSETAYAFVKKSDAVIFMLSVDTPINEIEIDFLKNTRAYAAKFFFVVNKIDTVSDEDLQEYLVYCQNLLSKLMDVENVIIFPVSAKFKTGISKLKENLKTECMGEIKQILQDSAKLKLKDIIVSALAQIELYWKVLLMLPMVLKENLSNMASVLEQFRQNAQEIVEESEANREFIIPGLEEKLKAKLNEFKMDLSSAVTNIFGMDYHYELAQIDSIQFELKNTQILANELGCAFLAQTNTLCDELETTLNRVLLYRNESTVEVVTQIYALNRLTRQLRRTRDSL
jgi:GTPase Era involved in 16S rRNA processing